MENANRQNRSKALLIAIFVVLCIGCIIWTIQSAHILHRVSKAISPDGTIKYEIYNCSLDDDSVSNSKDIITVREYSLTEDKNEWKLLATTELAGVYEEDYWSTNGQMFVVQVDADTESLYLFNIKENYMRQLDSFLDMELISAASFNSRLYRYLLSEGEKIHYKFEKWADNSDMMLIRYTVDEPQVDSDKAEAVHLSGYFWYDNARNSIKGLIETNK